MEALFLNSFIPWVGGKSRLRKQILSIFPTAEPALYVEVFGGAGWVLFGRDRHAAMEVFNDKDGHLINLYRCIQHHCEELRREIIKGGADVSLCSHELFNDYLEQLNTRGLTDIQRAARYFYIIRISYGAGKETFCCNRKTLDGAAARLPEIQQRLRNVVVENRDFEVLIKTYNRPGALFYCDPPYYNAEHFYQGFGPQDHARLRAALGHITGQFVLSYNDTQEIREMYSGCSIMAVERANNLASRKGKGQPKYKELIITNYK
jgi:DNA adenine methylase